MTLHISDRAARQMAEACRSRRSPEGGFRIRHRPDVTEADGLRVGFARRPEPDDQVIAADGVRVYVDADAAGLVDGYVLDTRIVGEESRLFLRPAGS